VPPGWLVLGGPLQQARSAAVVVIDDDPALDDQPSHMAGLALDGQMRRSEGDVRRPFFLHRCLYFFSFS
jgi:hypothetical protein